MLEIEESHHYDVLLQHLVDEVNNDDLEDEGLMEITLLVGSWWVSGTLISERSYYEYLRKRIVGFSKTYEKHSDTAHIHLKDAEFLHQSGTLAHEGDTWWRGRIAAVAGFIIGRIDSNHVGSDIQDRVADY